MARVMGPLHSESASGQLAKTTIFQTKGRNTYVRKYAVPGNTTGTSKMNQTAAQLAHQAQFKAIAEAWTSADITDQITWDVIAIPEKITRYNAYTRENWKRVLSGREITTVWPPLESKTTSYTVTGDPEDPPNPDPSGVYEQIDDINGMAAFYCSEKAFWLYYEPNYDEYVISDAPNNEDNNYTWGCNSETIINNYIPVLEVEGTCVVNLNS